MPTAVGTHSGVGAVDARLSANDQKLYVDQSCVDAVGEFSVRGGQLTEQGSVSFPAGATPAGIAVR